MRISEQATVKIVLLGAGGTGGYLIPHLYRIAHSINKSIRIIVCDGDVVKEKNLIRQNFVRQDIGHNKAKVLAERYAGAFGIAAEYVPDFIEDIDKLKMLLSPDFVADPDSNIQETQRVILISAVDNNKSRRLCHEVFCQTEHLIYIDSGNGLQTGQVVCGIREYGETVLKPVAGVYPELLQEEENDWFPSELSCAEQNISAPQSIAANIMAATIVTCFVYDLLITGRIQTHHTLFSSRLIHMRAEFAEQEYIIKPLKENSERTNI